ncbi:MAG: metallophosphoesterase family protein [Candidatus Zipacnadales bacterium]
MVRLRPANLGRCRLHLGTLLALALLSATSACQAENLVGVAFAVFGDNRGEKNGLQPPVFQRLIVRMAQLDIDFVLGTGDYIYGSDSADVLKAQWNHFFRAMAPLQSRKTIYFVPAPGNHEIHGGAGRQLFQEYFQRLHFSFDRGGSHFIVLDTEVPGQESRIAGQQLEWLKSDLARALHASYIFVVLHRPLYPVGPHTGDSLDMYPQERDALHQLFVRHKVTCVFAGHEHLYHRQSKDGVMYIITGGAGAPLYATPEKGGFHHFLYVKTTPLGYNIDVVRVK